MDINDFRAGITVLSFLTFIGICAWAWSRSAKKEFEQAQMLPFADDQRE